MKCLSCGKVFDYDKYYGICPKCGTYNKPDRQEKDGADIGEDPWKEPKTQESRGSEVDATDAGYTGDHTYRENTYTYVNTEQSPKDREERAEKSRKTLILLISIFLILAIVFALIKSIVVGYFGTAAYQSKPHVDVAQATMTEAEVGEEFQVEKDYGRSLTVTGVEVLADADTVGGLPTGQRLIAVRLVSNEVADLDYDTYKSSPVGDFYIYYDDSYRASIPNYKFDDGGYDDIIGNRQAIQTYDFTSQKNHSGYVFFFLPADADRIAFVYSVQDVKNGDLIEYVRVPLQLESAGDEDALGTQSMDENITTLPSTDDETMKPVAD